MRTHALSLLLLALLLLTGCGGSDDGTQQTTSNTSGGEADEGDAPPRDRSRPESAVAILRTGPLSAVLASFLPTGFPLTAETVPLEELVGGDAVLAEHIDRARGVQLLLGTDDLAVFSIGITGTVPADHLSPGARGELDRGSRWAIRRTAEEGSALFCVLGEAADGKRLVCGSSREDVVRAAPYMAHDVAGTRIEGAQLRFEPLLDAPAMSAVRERMPAVIAEIIGEVETTLGTTTTGPLANADVQREVLAFVRGITDAMRAFVVDAREADVTLSVRDGSYVLETRARYQEISSEWLNALVAALRTPAGWPTELFARLPPNGVSYALGTSDGREVTAIVAQLRALIDAFVASTTTLPAADRQALRAVIDTLFTPEVALTASASNMGRDAWNVVLAHTVQGPTTAERIARVRAMRAALSRRPIAAAIESALTVSGRPLFLVREMRDMTARELPPGGYGVRFKIRAPAPLATSADGVTAPCGTPVECVLRQAAPTEDQTYELVIAPLGDDMMLVFGHQARPLWTAVQQGTGPGVTPGAPAIAEAQILLARMFAHVSEQLGTPPMQLDAGDAPMIVRIEPTGEGPGGVVHVDIAVPVAFVQALVGIAVNGLQSAVSTAPE